MRDSMIYFNGLSVYAPSLPLLFPLFQNATILPRLSGYRATSPSQKYKATFFIDHVSSPPDCFRGFSKSACSLNWLRVSVGILARSPAVRRAH